MSREQEPFLYLDLVNGIQGTHTSLREGDLKQKVNVVPLS